VVKDDQARPEIWPSDEVFRWVRLPTSPAIAGPCTTPGRKAVIIVRAVIFFETEYRLVTPGGMG